MAVKYLVTGDVLGGLYLLGARMRGILRRVEAGIEQRSALRLRIAWAELLGWAEGTLRGLTTRW
jgi:hypothetical protein